MPRIPQVTRTLKTTRATVMCIDLTTQETFTQDVVLIRSYKDERQILKQASKQLNSDTVRAVYVVKYHVEETLYGMTEQEFIKVAKVLPSRNTTSETNK